MDSIFPYKLHLNNYTIEVFRVPAPRPRGISDIMPKLQNVAQTSKFLLNLFYQEVIVGRFIRQKGINDSFISDNIGLLCSDAVLPAVHWHH